MAIALDRYWAVTNVDYIHRRGTTRICTIIAVIWGVAATVSAAGFAWKDPDFESRLYKDKKCLVSQDMGYQIFATVATFYGPLVFILLLYWKIYQVIFGHLIYDPILVSFPNLFTSSFNLWPFPWSSRDFSAHKNLLLLLSTLFPNTFTWLYWKSRSIRSQLIKI